MSDVLKETIMAIKLSKPANRLCNFDEFPDSLLLSTTEVMFLSGRSRTSIWRDVIRGSLAESVRLGPQTVRWRVGDVRQFLKGDCNHDSK